MNAALPEGVVRDLREATLEDRWMLERGRVYMNGTQAILRLAMLQRQRDQMAGHSTAGFISGYRGSPLGTVDLQAAKARAFLEAAHVRFQAGVNEDLAATSVWGTQQVNMYPGARYAGVFGLWYGKGPGVDRCGDVFKHANAAGTSPLGGVLAFAGDDHGAKSSTLPHQSDHIFKACMMPVLYPANVQEYLDLGLHGFAMSRYAGVWVGVKVVTDIVEASSAVMVDPDRVSIALPTDFVLPEGGLNIRWPDTPLAQEARLLDFKLYAALAYCRANRLNQTVMDSPQARFGIVAAGKAYLDTRQALADLGLDEDTCRRVGLRLYKCGMIWPLEASGIRDFAQGLDEILVVEEKRQFLEYQLKEELFSWMGAGKPVPRVIGKFDEKDGGEWAVPQGNWILPAHYEFTPAIIAKAIATRMGKLPLPEDVQARMVQRLSLIEAKERALAAPHLAAERKPYYCSGCPHNTSTVVPEGSRAIAGIGCHYMVLWQNRRTDTFTQMGGEGVTWLGQAPFTRQAHVFANLGDGTYFHSGSLAIRAAVAAGASITYKILFNDAVAMTGGQPVDGTLTVPQITQQMAAEGVGKIVVVTDEPEKYSAHEEHVHRDLNARGASPAAWRLAQGVTVRHRDALDAIQRELRAYPGVSVLIYDQTCAAEKRRRRKLNTPQRMVYPDPPRRVLINEWLCEGCGDCSVQSNCLSVEPLETEFGRKRKINQSSCNKDYSCLKGFCPSLITIENAQLKAHDLGRAQSAVPQVPLPDLPPLVPGQRYGIVIMGIGGTGVLTIGQWIGMAAHLEGLGLTVLDMAGLAQKGGSVFSHVVIAAEDKDLFATRIPMAEADVLIGCDLIVTDSNEAISKVHAGRTRVVVNTYENPTADFVANPDWQFAAATHRQQLQEAAGESACSFFDAQALASALLGDAIYTNALLLGFAWQRGWLPVRHESLLRAMELNGVSVRNNQLAFAWGRACAHDLEAVKRAAQLTHPEASGEPEDLQGLVRKRCEYLTAYQNAAYAQRYAALVERVRQSEQARFGSTQLAHAVAHNYFKLLAYKDEYEVARLMSLPAFHAAIERQFEGAGKRGYRLNYYLAPPWLGEQKRRFGAWMGWVFRVGAHFKCLRGTILDPFGHSAERKMERALITEYEQAIDEVLRRLDAGNHETAIAVARLPETIRGFGAIKSRAAQAARQRQAELLAVYRNGAKGRG